MHIAAGKSHYSRRLMVSTAVPTLFRAQREATFGADNTQPALNVVFCLTATGTPGTIAYLRVNEMDEHELASQSVRLICCLQVGGGGQEVRQIRWRWAAGQCSGVRRGPGAWLHCWLHGERLPASS
jgi:hypothetical protein